jgi:NAD(P)-dependent dehydrogenase (short-subunit alcohol dehydrogenase family)
MPASASDLADSAPDPSTTMPFEIDLRGRRALITGAGQGIGRGIADTLAQAGAEVIVNDVVSDRADAAVDEIVATGGRARAAVFDVTDFDEVSHAVDAIGGVDILVNNAGNAGTEGMAGRGPFMDSQPSDWEPYLKVNLYGTMHCCRAVLPAMVERRWGRLITVVSDAGRVGAPQLGAYSAAKAGAAGLTRALAAENGQHGITANNISLGTMHTPLTDQLWRDPEQPAAKAILRPYAIRRPGVPDDVGPMVVYIASEHASWITGQTIPINGGYSFAL